MQQSFSVPTAPEIWRETGRTPARNISFKLSPHSVVRIFKEKTSDAIKKAQASLSLSLSSFSHPSPFSPFLFLSFFSSLFFFRSFFALSLYKFAGRNL